jgi:hypothetical protein
MRTGLLFSLMLMGLTAMGCGAGQTQEALDPSSDPAWIPPGQGDLAVADSPEAKPRPKPRARSLEKPNQREMDSRPLHAKMGKP